MKRVRISVLIPTRHRLVELRKCLDNLADLADRPQDIEVILGIDIDDVDSRAFQYRRMKIKQVLFEKREEGVVGYFNGLKDFSGDVCWVYSDENILHTKHWDSIILKFYDSLPMKIWMAKTFDYVLGEDKNGKYMGVAHSPVTHKRFGCFPIITKETVQTLGYIYPPYFRFWGADSTYDSIMKTVGRSLEINEIQVQTEWIGSDSKKAKYQQDLDRLIAEGKAKKVGEQVTIQVGDDVEKLNEAIKKEIPRRNWRIILNELKLTWEPFDY